MRALGAAGEAVEDAPQGRTAENGVHTFPVRLTVVNNGGQPQLGGKVKLPGEHRALYVAVGKIIMEIKSYLSYRNRLGMPGQFAQDIRISVRRRAISEYADGMVQTFIHPGKRLKTLHDGISVAAFIIWVYAA